MCKPSVAPSLLTAIAISLLLPFFAHLAGGSAAAAAAAAAAG